MRRNFSGDFCAQDLGAGAWRLSRRAYRTKSDVFLRGADAARAQVLRHRAFAISTSSGTRETVLLTFTSGGQARTVAAASAIVHEPWRTSTSACRWPVRRRGAALLAQGVSPGADSRRPLLLGSLARDAATALSTRTRSRIGDVHHRNIAHIVNFSGIMRSATRPSESCVELRRSSTLRGRRFPAH